MNEMFSIRKLVFPYDWIIVDNCICMLLWIVDPEEIRRLGKRFRKLDLDNSGSLSVEEFMSLPDLQQNPLVQRVIEIFDTDGNGEVDFKGLFELLWIVLLFTVSWHDIVSEFGICDLFLQSLLKVFRYLAWKATKNPNCDVSSLWSLPQKCAECVVKYKLQT